MVRHVIVVKIKWNNGSAQNRAEHITVHCGWNAVYFAFYREVSVLLLHPLYRKVTLMVRKVSEWVQLELDMEQQTDSK